MVNDEMSDEPIVPNDPLSFGELVDLMSDDEVIEFIETLRSFPVHLLNLSSLLDEATEKLEHPSGQRTLAQELSTFFYELDHKNNYFHFWVRIDEDSGVFHDLPNDELLLATTGEIGEPERLVRLDTPSVSVAGNLYGLGFFVRRDYDKVRIERFELDSPSKLKVLSYFQKINDLQKDLFFLLGAIPQAEYFAASPILTAYSAHSRSEQYFERSYEKSSFFYALFAQNVSTYSHQALTFLRFSEYLDTPDNIINKQFERLERKTSMGAREERFASKSEMRAYLTKKAEDFVELTSHMNHFSQLLFSHAEALVAGAVYWNANLIAKLFGALDSYLLEPSEANARAYYDYALAYQNLDPNRTQLRTQNGKSRIGPIHNADLKRAMTVERAKLIPFLEDIEIQMLFNGWEVSED